MGPLAYVVMELAVGRTVGEILEAGPLRPAQAVDIAEQIAEALEAAHQRGLIHGALKAENVFVRELFRGVPEVTVLDFGAGRLAATFPVVSAWTYPVAASSTWAWAGETRLTSVTETSVFQTWACK